MKDNLKIIVDIDMKRHRYTIADVLYVLEHGERIGSDVDNPEGSRVLQISDTLALLLADAIKEYVQEQDQ